MQDAPQISARTEVGERYWRALSDGEHAHRLRRNALSLYPRRAIRNLPKLYDIGISTKIV